MVVLPTFVSVHMCMQCLWLSEEGTRAPGTGATDGCKLLWTYRSYNLGPLEDPVLLTTEAPLQCSSLSAGVCGGGVGVRGNSGVLAVLHWPGFEHSIPVIRLVWQVLLPCPLRRFTSSSFTSHLAPRPG